MLKEFFMKKTGVILCLLILAAGSAFAADPAEGYWLSIDDKTGQVTAGWEIYVGGGKLQGKILSAVGAKQSDLAVKCKDSYKEFPLSGKVSQMPILGTPWIFALSPDKGPGAWISGYVIDPSKGEVYTSRITFHAADGKTYKVDTLEMRGSIGPFGKSQYWQKTTREQASGLK
jgi:uncharacterized protein (DUF2147 family)